MPKKKKKGKFLMGITPCEHTVPLRSSNKSGQKKHQMYIGKYSVGAVENITMQSKLSKMSKYVKKIHLSLSSQNVTAI